MSGLQRVQTKNQPVNKSMFRVISVIGFLSIVVAFVYVNRSSKSKSDNGAALPLAEIRKTFLRNLLKEPKKLVYLLGIASFVILTLTGFLPILFTGSSITEVVLLFHLLAAPLFAVCIAIVSVLWAHHHRFDKSDWQSFQRLIRRKTATEESNPHLPELGGKLSFWLILLLSLLVIGSISLGMYPFFGTHGQMVLLKLHGYTALLLVIVLATNFCLLKLGDK